LSYSPRSFSLGVDLIELRKAKSFYTRHKKNLKLFFTRQEISAIRKSKRPHERLAVFLAAKEAAFKASNIKNAGLMNFTNASVNHDKRRNLSVRFRSEVFRFFIIKKKNYIVVECQKSMKSENISRCVGI